MLRIEVGAVRTVTLESLILIWPAAVADAFKYAEENVTAVRERRLPVVSNDRIEAGYTVEAYEGVTRELKGLLLVHVKQVTIISVHCLLIAVLVFVFRRD